MEKLKKMMDEVMEYCRKNKIKVDLEAFFKKGKERMQYLWGI